ncbi:MAG: pyridoxal-phosphate dependent enzyme, partial [Planctomycetota bacterium]|nr:pyridoxal-phosphate dependent enzyme [Planctomycetota bacterium]
MGSTRLVDASTGEDAPEGSDPFAPDEGRLVDLVHDGARLARDVVDARGRGGVWRFRELVDPLMPIGAEVSLDEGDTPLLDCPDLARYAGVDSLAIKHEGRNPTGSFKDRGMTVAVSRAKLRGAQVLACASTGNTAASLAAYAARAGLRAAIVVPANATASGKLSQAVAHGARTVRVEG